MPDLVDEGNAAIIYQADWTAGLNGWPATAGWSSTGALLQNDGSDFGDANWLGGLWNLHWVAAPYAPPPSLANYAIEAEVQVMRRPQCGSFGVVAGGAYQIGLHMCSADSPPTLSVRAHNPQLSARSNSPQLLANLPLDPGDGWHLYRIELDGPDLHVLVDGVVVADIHDAGAGPAGPVGLWDDHTELAVRAFRVLGL
ncbi:MAG TPA: family 16 glycoside hydrolase [Chloroflexota bacterium]|nr:family 16 glycoside hydrolase [Chloroflexota bacterium]